MIHPGAGAGGSPGGADAAVDSPSNVTPPTPPPPTPDAATSSSHDAKAELGPPAPPAPPAALRMTFPISGVTTAAMVTARGTTDGQSVAGVLVNGTQATSSDQFQTWQASVALSAGDNEVRAVLQRSSGSQVQVSATVTLVASDAAAKRGKQLDGVVLGLSGGRVDAEGTAMYIADVNADGLLRIDIATGDLSWATCSEHSNVCGDGPYKGVPWTNPLDVAVDSAHQRAFVVDGPNVFGVDLTGNGGANERYIISGPDVVDNTYTPPTYAGKGTGPQALQFGGMAFDPAANVIYAIDWGYGNTGPVGFFAIDPDTGNRQVFSPTASNAVFRRIDVDPAKGMLFATAAYQSSLTKVGIAGGAQTGGPSIPEPQGVTVSDALGAVFAWDKNGVLTAFNNDTFASRAVTGTATSTGVSIKGGSALSVGADLIFLYEAALSALIAVDPQNGQHVVVSR
jgi:hypothetical protein